MLPRSTPRAGLEGLEVARPQHLTASSLTATPNSVATWCKVFNPNAATRIRLICFPHAGGHAGVFQSWVSGLPPDVQVWGIQLPGRRERMSEGPTSNLDEVLQQLGPAVLALADRPFALFGHSLGAILSFEVTRWLERHAHVAPQHLFVSGSRAPHVPEPGPIVQDLDDGKLVKYLQKLGGTPSEVFANAELLGLMLPTLRADLSLADTYVCAEWYQVPCPITAFGGACDEETTEHRLEEWRRQTTKCFRTHLLPGDHFFIHSSERELLTLISAALSEM